MLRLLKRSPLLKIPRIHQIAQSQCPFLPNLVSNGNPANPQTDLYSFTVFYFSSATSNLPKEYPKIKVSTLDFFHSYGFTDHQINRFININVSVETVRPKLEYLLAFGFSPSELIKIIYECPNILGTSLKKRIEPNLGLLGATIGSKTHITKATIRSPWLLRENLELRVIPIIMLLRENNIPTDKINYLFMAYPRVLWKDTSVIIETIGKLKDLGMSPSTGAFIHGMSVMATCKKETWERKVELYRSFGWSEKDTLSVFARQPNCLALSDDKIKEKMKFFKEKLQWDSAILAKWPALLLYSLEGRIIPRCAVLSVLAKRKLWEGKPNLFSLFYISEKKFKGRFVEKYEKEVPQVIDAYQGKIDFVGFEIKD